ncbi:YafY family protein [Clostridiaceae bacterium M8S5]|nr:YafY family protein [Clostridiaceae bacterium M8S5]
MKISRLFQIVYILLDKKKVTAKELSEVFEVSTKTIYRDIEMLSMAGIPIYTNKGKGGGINLLDNFVLNKSLLSEEEQNKILIGLDTIKATNYENVDNELFKLRTLFNKNNDNWIEVDFSYWDSSESEKIKFDNIKCALTRCKSLKFDYYNVNGNHTMRTINPLKLIFKEKSWYLASFCLLRNDYRIFKIHRMHNILITQNTFNRDDFSFIDKYTNFQETNNKVTINAIISSNAKYRVFEEFSIDNICKKDNGDFEVVFHATEDEWLYNYIISYGNNIKVLKPSYINDIIKGKLKKILENYN